MPLHTLKYTFMGLFFATGVTAAETGDLKHPDWHPDGRLLVAEGSCAGSIDLYLIDALATGDEPKFVGALTLDGSLLAYSSERTGDLLAGLARWRRTTAD